MPAQETISEQTSPAPWRRPCRRKAWTLTPAIGASTTRVGISTSRIHQDSRRFDDIGGIVARQLPGTIDVHPGAEVPSAPAGGRVPRLFRDRGLRRTVGLKEVILTPEGHKK